MTKTCLWELKKARVNSNFRGFDYILNNCDYCFFFLLKGFYQ